MEFQKFLEGNSFDAYEYFGVHIERNGAVFRIYAPKAKKVELQGDFNNWEFWEVEKGSDPGVFVCRIPNVETGMYYKYRITDMQGRSVMHCDPYGMWMELRPGFASRVADRTYTFRDREWMKKRDKNYNRPMNIYEVHAGSWKKKENGSWYNYEELAEQLIPYLKKMGFNFIEFLPLSEHPADCSWGYQNTGFFAPTSRYGSPKQLKKLVDLCHQNEIGVIMDFVPIHFATDDYGLLNFDGTPLYEFPHPDTAYSEWGTMNFMHSRGEVRSFLQSAADYWLSEFHMDGIRMDAISRAIYWHGDPNRGVNEKAVEFLRNMNAGLHKRHPSAILMAEDSTDFPKVTAPTEYDGLGFDYKWDMGFMNDTLRFFQTAPVYRPYDYHNLSFSMMYFYSDLFLLPFSHDEVVHGKATILQKMWGDYEFKFPQAKVFYTYLYTHPGKKLNFMGNEFGQFREWDENREQDWNLLEYPIHDAFHHFYQKISTLYLSEPALYDGEYNSDCFEWLEVDASDYVTYAYERRASGETILMVMNLSDQFWKDFSVGIPMLYELEELLHTDWEIYGGQTKQTDKNWHVEEKPHKERPHTLVVDLPPLCARLFKVKKVLTPTPKETPLEAEL
ncbi:MAG: 1,4-alpha-glucan branching protein GlgB [Lachnospiraceae bacterium]|nr:1,4-alpha-glucan branching protein GlgB [Lachnospiraceae bacterium]